MSRSSKHRIDNAIVRQDSFDYWYNNQKVIELKYISKIVGMWKGEPYYNYFIALFLENDNYIDFNVYDEIYLDCSRK